MHRVYCFIATITLAAQAMPAHAQFYGGYGPFGGWGWGWYGGAGSTVQGDIARGLGQFAVGAGLYNEHTARAEAIHADTLWRCNQYLYLSQQEANQAYRQRSRSRRDQIVRAREQADRRLRDTPTPRDIASGDALNAALDALRDPRVSLHVLKGAGARLRGPLVRDIPFQIAPAGITISVNQLLQESPPPVLGGVAFSVERKAQGQFIEELREELGERDELRPEVTNRGLDLIQATWSKAETVLPAGTVARHEAEAYLKGLSGLCRLLGTPATAVLLAGAEGHPETSLGELLSVMSLHDLRFGVARTPGQRAVYQELYPLLASLRDEIGSAVAVAATQTGGVRP